MAAPIVDQVLGRVYSKGISLSLNLNNFPTPSGVVSTEDAAWLAWRSGFQRVGGVKSIGGPTLSRDTIEINELDIGVGLESAANTFEQYFVKIKAPGDKDLQAIPFVLNMTHAQFSVLHTAYCFDNLFGFQIDFPQGATLIGIGFVQSLEPTIDSSKIVEIACELQPSFGIDYLTACAGSNVLHNLWRNYLYGYSCANVITDENRITDLIGV